MDSPNPTAPQGTGAKGLKMNNAMTRTEAARIVGESTLLQLDRVNCEPTNRVGFNGAIQGDESCEWAASISAQDTKGEQATVRAYYYTSNEEDAQMAEAGGDGSVIDWELSHYTID